MEQKPFAAFLDLISLDQKIHTIQKEILVMRKRLEGITFKQQEFMQRIVDVQSSIDTLRVQITLQEKEMQDIDQQEKTKKKLLATLSGYREIKALQSEIEALQRSQLEYEHLTMQSWNKLEHALKEKARIEETHAQMATTLNEEIALIESDILSQTHSLNELLQDRPKIITMVPAEWIEYYTMMTSKISDPVVPVEQESCSACFNSIAKQDMLRLQKKALLKCKTCFRLLYLPSVMNVGAD